MKQINFVVIFAMTMALVLFALQNPSNAKIQILPNFAVETSIAIEIIAAMGVGAILAWIFSVWGNIQRAIELGKKDKQIQKLQTQINELQTKTEEKQRLMAASAIDVEVEEKSTP